MPGILTSLGDTIFSFCLLAQDTSYIAIWTHLLLYLNICDTEYNQVLDW